MSDLIGLAQGAFNDLTGGLFQDAGWRGQLLPASFRGVRFLVRQHALATGRRLAVHEFPLRDEAFVEDLGRAPRTFSIAGYVLGDDYFAQRDALIDACEAAVAEPGTLIHPYLGEKRVRCQTLTMTEEAREGRVAIFDMLFVEAVQPPSPVAAPSTLSAVLKRVRQVMALARQAFALVYGVQNLGDFVRSAATTWLAGLAENLAGRWLGLPGLDLFAVRNAISGLTLADPGDAEAVALAVTAAPAALAAAAAAAPAGAVATAATGPDAPGSTAETSRAETVAEPGGVATHLLPLAVYAGAGPAPTGLGDVIDAAVAANRAALDALLRDAAVAHAAEVYANTAWPSADAALAAREAAVAAILARMQAAGDAGQDDLYLAWDAVLASIARDLSDRGARLPRLQAYALPDALPSLALAHRLYQDARQADALVALNRVAHPAAMPVAGQALA